MALESYNTATHYSTVVSFYFLKQLPFNSWEKNVSVSAPTIWKQDWFQISVIQIHCIKNTAFEERKLFQPWTKASWDFNTIFLTSEQTYRNQYSMKIDSFENIFCYVPFFRESRAYFKQTSWLTVRNVKKKTEHVEIPIWRSSKERDLHTAVCTVPHTMGPNLVMLFSYYCSANIQQQRSSK